MEQISLKASNWWVQSIQRSVASDLDMNKESERRRAAEIQKNTERFRQALRDRIEFGLNDNPKVHLTSEKSSSKTCKQVGNIAEETGIPITYLPWRATMVVTTGRVIVCPEYAKPFEEI